MMRINPVEIIKAINTSRQLREESVATYVRKIANQADELANIWEEIGNSVISGNKLNKEKLAELGINRWLPKNNRSYSTINEFYKSVSSALGSHGGSKWVDKITCSLGRIMYDRNNCNESLLEILENSDNQFFFSDDNQKSIINDLASSVVAIRKEAAALQVLADSIEVNRY